MIQEINQDVTTQEVQKEKTTTQDFSTFGLPEKLMQSLARMNFTSPTPIQALAIPLGMKGKDIIGSAQTGTGKTGAFGIPLIAKLMEAPDSTALILTPTRELATQVMATLQQLIPLPSIKTALLIGGEAMPKQFRQLQARPRVIVGTPGRVNDHLERQTLRLNNTRFLVLDETDRMLDMGFGIQLDRIAEYLPQQRQTMMFSATLPGSIMKLSAKYLRNPERIAVGSTSTPVARIKQELIKTIEADKYEQLLLQLQQREGSIIIFVKTKFGAERMATRLGREGHQVDALHGDLKQSRRDRVIQSFRDKKFRVLVATDVAARGLDIPHIEHVINYDLPQCPEDYIHRIGRTARAGAEGSAVNLLTNADGIKWKAIQKLINPGAASNDFGPSSEREGPQRRKRYGFSNGKPQRERNRFEQGGERQGVERQGGERRERFSERSSEQRFSERGSDRPFGKKPGYFGENKSGGGKAGSGKPAGKSFGKPGAKFGAKPGAKFGKPAFGKKKTFAPKRPRQAA